MRSVERMICRYLQKKKSTDDDDRISAHIWSRFLYTRLPKPGDEPKVQAARCDFGAFQSQVIENKRKINRETL